VPPPPTLEVSFSLPDGEAHFLIADEDDNDAETAMAKVNAKIMVNSNVDVIITPNFVEGANGVSVMKGDNVPFGRVSWELSQHDVLFGEGAVFMVQRSVIGANQEMEPPGDVAYVTCGPFTCTESNPEQPARPALADAAAAVCNAFEPDFRLEVGFVDNDVMVTAQTVTDPDATPPTVGDRADSGGTPLTAEGLAAISANDGLDIGWKSDFKDAVAVTHHFEGVDSGTNYSVAGPDSTKGSDKPLAMDLKTSTSNEDYKPALLVADSTVCIDDPYNAQVRPSARGIDKPESCFRIVGTPDYLSGYTLEASDKDGAISWGSVEWEDDPFEDLTCEPTTFPAAEQVNMQDLFEEEVNYAMSKGGKWVPSVTFRRYTVGTDAWVPESTEATDQFRAYEWTAKLDKSVTGRQFKSLWFDDNLDDKLPKAGAPGTAPGRKGLNDLYDANQNRGSDATATTDDNLKVIWKSLLDLDGDLMADAGDLGKVDLVSSKDDRSTVDDERTLRVESCPSGTSYAPKDGYSDETTRDSTVLDATPCKNDAQRGTLEGVVRTRSATRTTLNPDGNADNYEIPGPALAHLISDTTVTEYATTVLNNAQNRTAIDDAKDILACSEDDGGNDEGPDGNSSCDAEWDYDAEIRFESVAFGLVTHEMVTIECSWDASGEKSLGRNAAPDHFNASVMKNFISCKAN